MPFRDPCYQENGKWYWWEESWTISYGPYDTREDAVRAAQNYAQQILEVGSSGKTHTDVID